MLLCTFLPQCTARSPCPAPLLSFDPFLSTSTPGKSLVSFCSISGQQVLGLFPTSMAANSSRHCCCARGQGRMAFHLQGTVPPSPSSCSPLCITSRGESLQPAKGDLLRHTRPQTSTSYGTSFFHTAQIFSQTKGLCPITMSREQWEAEAGDHGGQFIFLSAGTRLSFTKCPRRNSKHSEKSHL